MEDRIIQLETLITLQDETIRSLNEEVFRQQKDITNLTERLIILEEKIRELQQEDPVAGNERPPHY
jgi:uncharacterized coiled-coil protein SlyX